MSRPVGELAASKDIDPLPKLLQDGFDLRLPEVTMEDITPNVLDAKVTLLGGAALLHVFTQYDPLTGAVSYGVNGAVSATVGAAYSQLSLVQRQELEMDVKQGMAEQAYEFDSTISVDSYFDESRAILMNQPLLFEPNKLSMLKGEWRKCGHDRARCRCRRTELAVKDDGGLSYEQRHILIAGLGALASGVRRLSP